MCLFKILTEATNSYHGKKENQRKANDGIYAKLFKHLYPQYIEYFIIV